MNSMQNVIADRTAGDSMKMHVQYGVGAAPFWVMRHTTTNPRLNYNEQFVRGHTNPVIELPGDTPADWLNVEEDELGAFLAFMDQQISHRPDLMEPADEAQLDRLSKLLANVKV